MLNSVNIGGRLVRDPEMRTTTTGTAVTSFTVACERDMKNANGEKVTDFINCTAWRATGEFINKYFAKGDAIIVSGSLNIREYTDKEGNKRNAAEIIVHNAYFAGSKRSSENTNTTARFEELDDSDGVLPF